MENYIKNVAGTSMGAFFSLAFALKVPIEELEKIVIKTINNENLRIIPSNKFVDIFMNLGFNDSRLYLKEIKEYVKNKYDVDDLTFMELSKITGVNIYVSTTRVNDGTNFIFNVDDTPNVSVFDAIAASMCIPILSKPIRINNAYYVDGCISNNLPYDVFQNINQNDILCVAVYIKADYDISKIPNMNEDEDMNLTDYFKQICDILYLYSTKQSYINRIENFKNPLIITKSHFKTFFNFEITKEEIRFNISENDIETLILQGFHDMAEYIKSFNEEAIDF
jgi:predicted acylesterase/phospholipase RssA